MATLLATKGRNTATYKTGLVFMATSRQSVRIQETHTYLGQAGCRFRTAADGVASLFQHTTFSRWRLS